MIDSTVTTKTLCDNDYVNYRIIIFDWSCFQILVYIFRVYMF